MYRSIIACAAMALGAMLFSTPALASQHDPALDEVFSFGDIHLAPPYFGGQPVSFTASAGVATQGKVVGISFSGTVSGVTADPHDHTWASDVCLVVIAPDGTRHSVGGRYALSTCYPNGPAGPYGPPGSVEFGVRPWQFQRATDDGSYQSTHHDAFAAVGDAGEWTFIFVHDHNHEPVVALDWSDIQVTLHKTNAPFEPSPGKLALLRDLDTGFAKVGRTTLPVRNNRVLNSAGGGGSPIEIAGIEIVGDGEIQQVGGTCAEGTRLPPGDPVAHCTVVFACAPSAPAEFSANLEVTTTDGQRTTSSLTCNGLRQHALIVEPARHRFGRIDPAGSATFDFTVRNNAGFEMFFNGWDSNGGPTDQYQLNYDACLDPLPAGGSCTLSVTFAPDGDEGSWAYRFLPWFFAPTTLGAFIETSFGVSGGTRGAGHLSLFAAPAVLLPANGRMRNVRLFAFASPYTPMQCAISAVRANEPIEGDYAITGDMTVELRAEQMGNQRIYLVETTCTTEAGREHVGIAQVRVPKLPWQR